MTEINVATEEHDLLDVSFINSLPQTIWALHLSSWWPVYDFEVQTGLLRIDVCGLLDVLHIGDVREFRDGTGKTHAADDFYADPECWVGRDMPAAPKVSP